MMEGVLTIETLRAALALSASTVPPEPMLYPIHSNMYDNLKEYMGVTDEVMRNNYRLVRTDYLTVA